MIRNNIQNTLPYICLLFIGCSNIEPISIDTSSNISPSVPYYSRNIGDTWSYFEAANLTFSTPSYYDTYRVLELQSISQANNIEQYIFNIRDSVVYYNSSSKYSIDSIKVLQSMDTCYNLGDRIISTGKLTGYFLVSENDSILFSAWLKNNPDCSKYIYLGTQLETHKYIKYDWPSSRGGINYSYLSGIGLYHASGGSVMVGGTGISLIKYNNIMINANFDCL